MLFEENQIPEISIVSAHNGKRWKNFTLCNYKPLFGEGARAAALEKAAEIEPSKNPNQQSVPAQASSVGGQTENMKSKQSRCHGDI